MTQILTSREANLILNEAEELVSAADITKILNQLAAEITETLSDQNPIVLCIMKGAVIFSGQLLPLLKFPLSFDYLHVTRYNNTTQGGQISWKVEPQQSLEGRVVLVLDDVLDEGITLASIREKVMDNGAKAFYSAVLADKAIGKPKPFQADFVGLTLPNRYVFGFGMDIQGAWRNLPAIYAIKN
jgi:hypoxanthine phosphoribosyltransferase